ncbi:DUF2279 domain-containing protein [Sphingobium aquiterrae]|uniref:DUF2279 domain-containing protein n=1 Tax=Sphingobium aquiterrae TaxID=2038656 RepID=UPI0030178551
MISSGLVSPPLAAETLAVVSDDSIDVEEREEAPAGALAVSPGDLQAIDASLGVRGKLPFAESTAPVPEAVLYGPPAPGRADPAPHDRRPSFGTQFDAVKWEVGGVFAYMTVSQLIVTKETTSFHFQDEGWFGRNTTNLGVDKLTHAFNAYVITEYLQSRIQKRTGGGEGTGALTAALLSSGLMIYSELYDAHKVSSGFSPQDVIFNTAGAALSALRQSVPGLEDKLDFRLLLMPNADIYTFKGKRHYAQQRYMLALRPSGFGALRNSPLRFVEFHAGYYGENFTNADRAAGLEPRRHLFFGVGIDFKELFFKRSRSTAGGIAKAGLTYFQIPYTAVHLH